MTAIRILVASDGKPPLLRACELVGKLAGNRSAEVRLVAVVPYEFYPRSLAYDVEFEDTPEMKARLHAEQETRFEEARKLLEPVSSAITEETRFGNVGDEILKAIEEWEPDLVVMGKGNVHGPARWILGSVSRKVMSHSPVPALIST